jgi:hypothetical protein
LLADYGESRFFLKGIKTKTKTNAIGTYIYITPELIRGENDETNDETKTSQQQLKRRRIIVNDDESSYNKLFIFYFLFQFLV